MEKEREATRGSQTKTEQEVGSSSGANGGEVLKLKLKSRNTRRVCWTEDTHDNEHEGKRKSKKCCIFHKQRAFDESSSESEGDSDDSSSSGGGPSNGNRANFGADNGDGSSDLPPAQ